MNTRILACLALFGIGVFAPINAEELGSGDFEFTDQGHQQKALHLDSTYDIAIQGMIATVTLEQQFQNTGTAWLNGRYVFPLAETAAVSFMQMRIGEHVITSTIQEKQQAKATFEAAKREGKKAALTEQHRPNVFSQSVANIGPGEIIVVTLKYTQPVHYNAGLFSFRLPTTMTPRYHPKPNKPLHPTLQDWPLSPVEPSNPIGAWIVSHEPHGNYAYITARLNAGLPLADVQTLYHQSRIQKQQGSHIIETQQSRVLMDRDYVLQWRATASSQPQAAVFYEHSANEHYAMLMLVPPAAEYEQALAKESLFIIDTSGSMQGPSMSQAKQSLLLALNTLSPNDHFNIYEFDNQYTQLFSQSQRANPSNLAAAKQFVKQLKADGGTEMAAPLAAALTAPPPQTEAVRQVIFITDGAVSNESQLFGLIHQNLGTARLFTVGIGAAPNSYFMRKAAQFGRGSFTHIGNVNEVNQQMNRLFSKLSKPQMQHIQVQWQGSAPETWPKQLPDLYAGEPVVLYSKLNDDNTGVTLRGQLHNRTWQQQLAIDTQRQTKAYDGGISKLWARQKIDALLDKKITGTAEPVVREEVLKVALKHHVLSPYTSLIAVEEVISRPQHTTAENSQQPLNLPKGSPQTLAIPQTATGYWGYVLRSLLCLLLLGVSQYTRKKATA